ncbi:MAG: hypothetical protein AB7P03_13935 [Kofleriaceae bacterium]
MRTIFALVTLVATGCSLYFDEDHDDDDVYCGGAATKGGGAPYTPELRNPETAECEAFPSAGGGPRCDVYAGVVALPDWGSCDSFCEGLAEDTCLTTASCRAMYRRFEYGDDAGTYYFGCAIVAPSGPVRGGDCAQLDAHECSRHDDCAAMYLERIDPDDGNLPSTRFDGCAPEPQVNTTCDDVDCGMGSHCEQQCREVLSVTAGGWVCHAVCVPDVATCSTVDCGAGYECVETCTDGGGGIPPLCEPTCMPVTSCEALKTEMDCLARGDCTPVYEGDDCTCYPDGCSCEILTYERCEPPGES